MTTDIILKKSSVSAKAPTTGDLSYGELALNYQDGYLYYKDASDNITRFLDSARTYDQIFTQVNENYINDRIQQITGDLVVIGNTITFRSTDAGALEAPTIDLNRASVSPADSDTLASLRFTGRNSSDSDLAYAYIRGRIESPTANSETGELDINIVQNGFDRTKMRIRKEGIWLDNRSNIVFTVDSFQTNFTTADTLTANRTVRLPDADGTIVVEGASLDAAIESVIDSAYVQLRQATSAGVPISFITRDATSIQLITTTRFNPQGGVLRAGPTITLLDKDSAEVIISL